MKKGFAALAIVGIAAAVAVFALNKIPYSGMNLNYENDALFARFLAKHNKSYETKEEYEMRRALFIERLQQVTDHNAQNDNTWFMAINHFSDMLPNEIANMMGGGIEGESRPHLDEIIDYEEPIVRAGTPVDWRSKMNAVRNQGSCGSCWSFAATAAFEGRYAIKKGTKVELSEQQMVDCATACNGCGGGWSSRALQYVQGAGGQMSRASYPYVGYQSSCKFSSTKVAAKISSVSGISDPKTAVASGPVAVYLQATSAFQSYGGGIFNGVCGQYNHAVTVVGWGASGSSEYWIIRNSWGTGWGESGHIRVAIGGNCRITFDSYPIVA
jgi:hypothetical protein